LIGFWPPQILLEGKHNIQHGEATGVRKLQFLRYDLQQQPRTFKQGAWAMTLEGTLRGIALGAGAMYFFDPVQGRRRRALVRDQFIGLFHRTGDFFDKAFRDAQHRIEGTIAETSNLFQHEQVSDEVLVERVRSKIGRYCSHPRALEVVSQDGRIVLSGTVLKQELPRLLSAVWGTRGVREVEDHTTSHAEAGTISDLQGGRYRSGDVSELFQANWAPATRLFMGGVGTMLMLNCLARRNLGAALMGSVGFGLVMTSMSNCAVQTLEGKASSRQRRRDETAARGETAHSGHYMQSSVTASPAE
jgi:hypothetical protein